MTLESWVKHTWLSKKLIDLFLVVEYHNDPSIEAMRLEKCSTCPCNVDGICRSCGCVIKTKAQTKVDYNVAKNRNEITHCPLGLWGDHEIVEHYLTNKNI